MRRAYQERAKNASSILRNLNGLSLVSFEEECHETVFSNQCERLSHIHNDDHDAPPLAESDVPKIAAPTMHHSRINITNPCALGKPH